MASRPTIKKMGAGISRWGGLRERPDALNIPWDDLTLTLLAGRVESVLHIPREFWIGRGVRSAVLATDAGVANVKDKLRRNFYRWRRLDPSRGAYTVTFKDVWKGNKYVGVDAYMVLDPPPPKKTKRGK